MKQAHEIGCLKAAQESLVGFPQGAIKPGDDPPDCYVVAPGSDPVAFELTEQVDSIATRAAALARRFIGKAGNELFRRHPELRTGWMISASPGDVFEAIAAQPQHQRVWKERRGELIDRFVSAVTGEITARYSYPWRVSGEPIWTFGTCRRVQPQTLTRVTFQGAYGYSYKNRDRLENDFGRDVTLRPEEIRKKIARKARDLKRYPCRPAYLLISASLFPRSVRSARSFAVLKTPESVVDHSFDIGAFTAIFLHDPDGRSYRIGQGGLAVEMERRSIATARFASETRARSRPSDVLDRQLAYFRRHQKELAEEHHGKVALIRDEDVVGFFDSDTEGVRRRCQGRHSRLGLDSRVPPAGGRAATGVPFADSSVAVSNGDTPRLSEWAVGPERRGFTLDYDLAAAEIITPVGASAPYGTGLDDASPVLARAGFDGVWDTGATCSVVSSRIVDELRLEPIDRSFVETASGTYDASV